QHLVDHDRGFRTAVVDNLAQRLFNGATQDANTGVLVVVVALDLCHGRERTQQRNTTAGHDAFFDGGTRGVQRVFDTRLLFLHLDFGGRTNLDQRHTAGELGYAFLQLLAAVIGGGFLDLAANLLDARFDVVVGTGTIADGGVFLRQLHLLGFTEVVQGDVFQRHAEVSGDYRAAGQNRRVFEHGLAPITEARGLGGR